ncbi:hypothetical protein FNF29_06669 [Cafeteria roenbergensis]|uniref:Delta(14)-sterol reductase n=1 Tax=Cafeteria roenbergensis TaxID=33653 RepID=A0A5A8C9C8_CAFRO|nr:hypothetical protein FNF29_06669 [Cafeteria roenbergensis]KAA0154847.1 hypothetical protein FNF31_06188 [Cafeteria roenbergensis]KAA0161568.1 hypothetical protein FNF28_05024 [Cafeteria roenbergensis]|eukprot:KAA0148451.1 hypothetical protein FNF29_06669 [Cafeteria roenbergensis]
MTERSSSSMRQRRPARTVPAAEDDDVWKPRTVDPEFGGPVGTFIITILMSLTILSVTHTGWLELPWQIPDLFTDPAAYVARAATSLGFAIPAGWWLLHLTLHVVLPGRVVLGVPLPTGQRLRYKLNGFACVALSVVLALAWHVACETSSFGLRPSQSLRWLTLSSSLEQLAFGTVCMCFAKSTWLYLASFQGRRLLAEPGNSGVMVYDWFMGRELNPRLSLSGGSELDLKFFNELRPGMSAWVVLALAPAVVHLQDTGAGAAALAFVAGRDPVALVAPLKAELFAVVGLQVMYVLDSVLFEEAILTTMDIIMDGFGFMLCAGDLAWVPFTFSLQGRYILQKDEGLPLEQWLVAAAVGLLGFAVFRLSNLQKNTFKADMDGPAVRDLPTIPARSLPPREGGGRLLAGGWWGMARHINYLGDWLLGLSWCLLTGFEHPVPYLYAFYFAFLLLHRERRDDHKCAQKYGPYWKEYRALVPWRIIPFLY